MEFNSDFKGLMKLEFSRQILEKKNLNITFNQNNKKQSICTMRTDRQTDRHDTANIHARV